tara:strand:- start:1764 stop:1946 length:183 start_codon:yes stop_codon:yes gene_type:complete
MIYTIYIQICLSLDLPKQWQKVKRADSKEKILKSWNHIKKQNPNSKYTLKHGSKIIDKIN